MKYIIDPLSSLLSISYLNMTLGVKYLYFYFKHKNVKNCMLFADYFNSGTISVYYKLAYILIFQHYTPPHFFLLKRLSWSHIFFFFLNFELFGHYIILNIIKLNYITYICVFINLVCIKIKNKVRKHLFSMEDETRYFSACWVGNYLSTNVMRSSITTRRPQNCQKQTDFHCWAIEI